MTRKLEETLNLPYLDDLLKSEGLLQSQYDSADALEEQERNDVMESVGRAEQALSMMGGQDHGEAMDVIHKETLDHARSITDLAFNVDHARAARMFEVAANYYKAAIDAKNSKRDAQLKAMQLALSQQKFELEKKLASNDPHNTIIDAVVVEDRNELIKRFRAQVKEEQENPKP